MQMAMAPFGTCSSHGLRQQQRCPNRQLLRIGEQPPKIGGVRVRQRSIIALAQHRTTPLTSRKHLPLPAAHWGQSTVVTSTDKEAVKLSRTGGSGPEGDDKPKWGVFDWKAYNYRWDVPWGAGTVAGGLALWFLSFLAVGFIVAPGLYRMAGACCERGVL